MTTARRTGTKSRKRGPYAPEATRKQLLSAALSLFSDRGFRGTTVDAIVERARVTKGAFYHHFENKEDVLRQIHSEYASEMLAGAREVKAATELEPIDQLRQLIERAVILLGRHHEHVAVFYQEFRFVAGEHYAAIRRMNDEQEEIFLEIVERARAAKQLRADVNSKLLLFSASGITAWIYQWYQPSGELTLEQIARSLADIILLGVALPGGAPVAAEAAPPAGRAAAKRVAHKE